MHTSDAWVAALDHGTVSKRLLQHVCGTPIENTLVQSPVLKGVVITVEKLSAKRRPVTRAILPCVTITVFAKLM